MKATQCNFELMLILGCPTAMIQSPISHFHFQEFDFSSYLAYKSEGFVGRKWFFLELENIFEESPSTAGVLITGEPGSGKSALMSQLICSPFSSLLIHENTIGYHLCEYSEKGKRDGARFVRNLVDQIAVKLPKYSDHVKNHERVRIELDTRCHKDPTSCFFTTIVGPLRKLEQPSTPQFIVIDALDECFESDTKTSEILDILKSKILAFPKWLKVILTSRNLTSVTSKLPQVINRTSLFAADNRNVNDIRFYVSRFISQNSNFMDRLLTAMDYSTRTKGLQILDEVITRAEGNFLVVKTILQYMNDTGGKVDFQYLPTSLFDLYNVYFDRQFGTVGFDPFRFLFEVLLAAYSPFQAQHVEEILVSEYEADDFTRLTEQVSCFLRFERDGTIRIYHQSFAEWLTNQSPSLSINKTRGHQRIAKFLMHRMRERHVDVTFGELTELFIHILSGREFKMQETAMNLFSITEMREAKTNQSILHYLVTKPTIYLPVFDFFLQKFKTVEVLDANKKTPAFYAASEGNFRGLQSCIENGANVGSFLEGYSELDPVSVVVTNTGIAEFSVMHVAAAKGHKDIVELLLQRNISLPDFTKRYPTPLHLAAANGHLEVVRLFYDYNETFDLITLHHAAARNHFAVVHFLLSTVGLRDSCAPCQPEHFSLMSKKITIQESHAFFCETALHAAVSRGLTNIVQLLLNFSTESLECKHHSGKTVLMDTVERNNTEMVGLLLKRRANTTSHCGRKMSKDSVNQICSVYAMYKKDFLYTVYCVNDSCECGYTAIHISAKYGLWNMAEILLSGRVEEVTDIYDCDNDSATHVAIIYDHVDFVTNVCMSLEKVGQYFYGSKIAKQAMRYCSANVANGFLNYIVDEDEEVWYILRMEHVSWSPCRELDVVDKFHADCFKGCENDNHSNEEKIEKEIKRHLNIIKLLMETHQQKSSFLYKKDHENKTLLHYAALSGFAGAVKYLVELGADVLLKDNNGDTPLMIALKMSPFNDLNPSSSYRCYTTNDGQFGSCKTTCYDETVRYLVQSQKANISKCDDESALMLEQVIIKRMPLSLYALMKVGVDWNCPLIDGTSVTLLHLHVGGREVTEVIKMFEVDVSVKCGVPFSNSELHQLSYFSIPGAFGNFFQPSLNKKRSPLQRLIDRHPRGVRILDECYDGGGYLPIHRAVEGGNLAAIKWFKSVGVNTQLKTQNGFTTFDISVFVLSANEYRKHLDHHNDAEKSTSSNCNKCFEEVLRAFFDTSHKNYSSDYSTVFFYERPVLRIAAEIGLDAVSYVYNKALQIISGLRKSKHLLLDEQDLDGNTPLNVAAYFGHESVVKYLVGLAANINIRNKNNHTPMLNALLKAPRYSLKPNAGLRCYTTDDGLFTSCQVRPYDEIVSYLISLQKSSISKCDSESALMLGLVVIKRMPLSLYALLKKGVDWNCPLTDNTSAMLLHLHVGGREVTEVIKMFEVDVSIKCGISFSKSEMHQLSYFSTPDKFGNFFQPSLNKKRFPLQKLIDRHPRGVRILDECYDAEGNLPIHRAAQGGNLAAIKWFKSVGVNTQLKTRTGFTALDISVSVLSANEYRTHLDHYNNSGKSTARNWNKCFEEVLRAFLYSPHKNYSSDYSIFSFSKNPILHVAAEIGLDVLIDVYNKALEIIPGLKKSKYLLLDEKDAYGDTPLHVAAYYGRERVVKHLVRLGADINIRNNDNYTPMLVALSLAFVSSTLSYVDHHCYSTDDGLFTSCKTTAHDEIVRYLMSLQKSSISNCDNKSAFLLNTVVEKRMPLSLYALLKIGVDVNCQQNKCRRLLFLEHLKRGGREISEVFKIFEVNISVRCGICFTVSELHLISYIPVSKEFGNFFQLSLNKKSSPMQRLIDSHPKGVRILDECYDAEGYLPIHRAAQGGNLVAIKWFKSVGVNTQLKTRTGLTALDISIKYLRHDDIYDKYLNNSKAFVKTNTKHRRKCLKELLQAYFGKSNKNFVSDYHSISFSKHRILHTAADTGLEGVTDVYKMALKIIPGLKKNKHLLLNEQDANGDTPLHIAAYLGHESVVKYLVGLGADINIKNKNNHTPMLSALLTVAFNLTGKLHVDHRCYTTIDGLFTLCETAAHDEITSYLIWLQKLSISRCDDNSTFLLNNAIGLRKPLSLYALLKVGVDVKCQENKLSSPFLKHVREGGREVSEVLKIFEANFSVSCGVPFFLSVLHLISYIPVSADFGNFFKPSLNKKASLLQRLIDSHPRGVHILDECYDAEGYLPIHRAAQGGNLVAIKWFQRVGVNTHLKTRTGLTALDISILYVDVNYAGELDVPSKILLYIKQSYLPVPYLHTTLAYREDVFKELLRTFLGTMPESKFPCGPTLKGLSLLHIAAVKGLPVLQYVHQKASEIFPSLPINCINEHQLDPVYLAKFYESVRNEGLICKHFEERSDENLKEEIVNHGRRKDNNVNLKFGHGSTPVSQYPNRESEYFMVFNYLYHPPPSQLPERKYLSRSSSFRVSDCPGYYDAFQKFDDENSSPALPDETRCSKIRRDSDKLLCQLELLHDQVTYNCHLALKLLQLQYTTRRRTNRQLSQFILKRLGWSDGSQVKDIDERWPFYYLHKLHLKEYKAYKYLEVLNEALEVADVRFYSRLSDDMTRLRDTLVALRIPHE